MTGKDQSTDITQPTNAKQAQVQAPQQGIEPVDTPAPRYSAAASFTWMQQKQQQQLKDRIDPGIPDAARPVALENASFVPLPAGGLAALADSLFPGDKDNEEAMHEHVIDLFIRNRDILRDGESSTVGTMVRIP